MFSEQATILVVDDERSVTDILSEGEGDKTRDEEVDWTRYLGDIADGVQARLDLLTGHVMTITVTERTIDIARNLEIPEKQIEKWAGARRKHIEQIKTLDSLSEKIE